MARTAAHAPTTDFSLATGQTLSSTNEDALWVHGVDWRVITIHGQITVTGTEPVYGVSAINAAAEYNGPRGTRSLTISKTGVVNVSDTAGNFAGAVSADGTVKMVSHGVLTVKSAGDASGVSSLDFQNHGSLTVEAARSATGVSIYRGGRLTNDGSIVVSGGAGPFDGVTGVRMYQTPGFELVNTGIIRAVVTSGAGMSVGVQSAGYTSIVNSGLIEGGRSVVVVRDEILSGEWRQHTIVNTGTLRGDAVLNNGTREAVVLRNSGRVEGAVTLNLGADLYDGAGGVVTGVVKGDSGADTLIGGAGAETLQGGEGNDVIDGGAAGADALDGGAGVDLLTFDGAAAGVTLDVTLLTGSRGLRFADFEAYVGSRHADSFKGGAAADVISAGEGADTVVGGAGDDRIEGGGGRNYLRGEEGHDSLLGGSEFDDLHGNVGHDTVSGGDGDDWVVGGQDHDLLYGDAGSDVVLGNLGNDTVRGGEGSDVVRGGQGDDLIRGDAGDDYVSGDRGADTIYGGAGADLFHTFSGAGLDRITDFNAGEGDRVNVLAGTTYTLRQEGVDTVVDMGNGDQVVLVGVTLSTLPAGWIFTG
jgi:Ca2+-binding RTX toxin-like protein